MTQSRKIPGGTALVLLTCLLFALGPMTVDLSLPTLPAIQQAIGTGAQRVELTLTAVLLGMAVGQLLIGAVADAYGRRIPLLASLAVFSGAAVACAMSPDLQVMAAARFVQALGLGVAVVMARSLVTDAFEGRAVARVYSTAVMATGVSTVVAPLIGGQLLASHGWRAVFVLMAVFGAACAAFVLIATPETLPVQKRSRAGFGHVLKSYLALLRMPAFSGPAIIGACAGAAQFAYNTGAPSTLIERYSLTPAACGAYMAAIALSMAVCSQINGWLLRWFTPAQLLSVAVPASLVGGLLVFAAAATGAGAVNGIAAALLINIAALGFILPNALAISMVSAGQHAGTASALIGVLMFAFGTIGSAAVGAARDSSGRAMAVVMCIWAVIGLVQVLRMRNPRAPSPA
ncbi:MAG: multidrug effflux MFS transporter [Proteobacteria bacterium]|nr:multidrug effflux MFS transporter [Pseudomonadota bacterium]